MTGCRLKKVLLESLMLAAEMFDHVLQLDLTDLCLIQQESELVLQLCQRPCQVVSFLSKQTANVRHSENAL